MSTRTLNDIIIEIQQALNATELNLKNSYKISQFCNKPLCEFCDKIGYAKATFTKTKIMLREMIKELQVNHVSRTIFDTHIRKDYGNYQAWILPGGHYINVWKTGGHSLFTITCEDEHREKRIKVHAQGEHSNIIFYDSDSPPTEKQIETIKDILTDSLMWNYRITFSFAYDAFHPLLNDMSF